MALGPYHHFDPQLQVMETKKRDAVGDYLQSQAARDLTDFITQLHNTTRQEELEPIIRDCYDRYLDLDYNTLLLITILDAIVLLHFLRTCLGPEHRKHAVYSNLHRLVPDVFMLENQIPIILIHATCNSLNISSLTFEEAGLSQGFHRFCAIHSPFPLTTQKDEAVLSESFRKSTHLLHFIYLLIVKHKNPQSLDFDTYCHGQSKEYSVFNLTRTATDMFYEAASFSGFSYTTVYWTGTNSGLKETPSVYNLHRFLQMKFIPLPESCGIEDIGLNTEKNKLCLPVIRMGANSEVILRNLVAYEAAAQQQTPIRDFLDLMCGLVKSETDVRYLKEAGIIKGELSNLEILKICYGLKNSDEKPDDNNKVYSVIKEVNILFENARYLNIERWSFKISVFVILLFRTLSKLMKNIKELVADFQTPILVIAAFFVGVRSNGIALGYQNPAGAGGAAARDNLIFGLDHPQAQAAAEVLMLPRKLLPYHSHLPY